MINYNIINEFIEKLKAGKTTASDINTIAEAYKNGELTNTVNLIEVENIKAIPSSVLEDLNCGDTVVKNENGNKHAYVVTYKEHHQGICLTYIDASMCETQSYDYVTDTWTYNSQDTFTFVNYTPGTNVSIEDGVISATDTTYTAGEGIEITDGVISSTAQGGEVWESVVNIAVANNVGINVRLFTNEEITNSNVRDIIKNELVGNLKELPCWSDDVVITIGSSTGIPMIISASADSSPFLIQLLKNDFTRNGINGTASPNNATLYIYYSHKLN